MENLRWFLAALMMMTGVASSSAKDSQQLSNQRRQVYAGIDFYCSVGRQPIVTSDQAWAIQPTASCNFAGPLDTKINRLSLQPPLLKPWLTMNELTSILRAKGIGVQTASDHLQIELPSGAPLEAMLTPYSELVDNLMKLAAYPLSWPSPFIAIRAQRPADLEELIRITSGTPMYWSNPHVKEETQALPLLQGDRPYLPVALVSECDDEWKNFGGAQSLLLVGDLHTAKETDEFTKLVQARKFAFVALELPNNWQNFADEYLKTEDPVAAAKDLELLISRHSKDVQAAAKNLLINLKRLQLPIVLMDYEEDYFNFPYTSTGFHGLIMATRNLLWVSHLPAKWQGTGALLGGVDHFAVTPNADFQNFAKLRFPQVDLALIDPYETCAP